MTEPKTIKSNLLRALPSVNALLQTETARALSLEVGAQHLTRLARAVTDELRAFVQEQDINQTSMNGAHSRASLLEEASRRLERACQREAAASLRHVINASGVILHTNLGRAPLSDAARRAISTEAARYCTLEYNLETGGRGRRGARAEQLLRDLTGAEAALVVNNCAAAALLILTVLGQGGETIISRGELVEIGGDFRVPDVMAQSGTYLKEVGATNKTRLLDYRRAITEQTRLVMRVHPSNYRIVGFTSTPEISELADLAHECGLPLYEDAGSGALSDLESLGLAGEPVIAQSVKAGADLISFSGDKLLGASQAGLIVGRGELVERLRKHPLYRALRADKLSLAALEATLEAHRRGAATSEIPALRMLALTQDEIRARAESLVNRLKGLSQINTLHTEIIEGASAIGGGSAPNTHPPTALIALTHETLSADALEEALRRSQPPIVARISLGRVVLDLRTVALDEEAALLAAIAALPF